MLVCAVKFKAILLHAYYAHRGLGTPPKATRAIASQPIPPPSLLCLQLGEHRPRPATSSAMTSKCHVRCGVVTASQIYKRYGRGFYVGASHTEFIEQTATQISVKQAIMGLPAKQRAAVKSGSGHESKAPVQNVAVPQEPGPL